MKHQISVSKYNGTIEELASDLGNLNYSSLSEFLKFLSEKIELDSKADLKRNRKKLSKKLKELSDTLGNTSNITEQIYKICEPYMK